MFIHNSKTCFINSPTRATAPRLPCISPYCKICDIHEISQNSQKEIKIEMPYERPKLTWHNLSEDLLPHLEYVKTPPRIY
jgi:hypothetical protein